MKLLFKTLQGKTFHLDADEAETVAQLKQKVGHDQGYDDPSSCKLIFAGKVLKDADTLAQVNPTPDKFLVVMPPTKKAAPKRPAPPPAAPAAASTAPAATPVGLTAPTGIVAPSGPPVLANPEALATAINPAGPDPNQTAASPASGVQGLVMGTEFEATVKNICEMGFEESQVRRAMRASFHNPDRAIDYLFNGIPESAEQAAAVPPPPIVQQQQQPHQANPAGSNQPFNMFPTQSDGSSTGGGPGNLDFLRGLPQFSLMRRAIQQDPTVLQSLLEQLASTNPALLNLIQANQAEFDRLIQEPLTAEDELVAHAEATEAMGELQRAEAMGDAQGGASFVEVNEEEREQIERLEELVGPMGLNRNAVLRAWLACDKNEELAANYLLNNLEDVLADQREGEGDGGGAGG